MTDDVSSLTAFALTCSLKPSPASSSTEKLTSQVLEELSKYNVAGTMERAVNYQILPGVEADMGNGDDWPKLRQRMLDADIFILATPTWMGQMSSIAQRILERLDAELSFGDNQGRYKTYGKVAAAIIVGNEDGGHKITADTFQALNDVGFTIAASSSTFWNGEAMTTTEYNDLDETPEAVTSSIQKLASNTAHLASLLKTTPYPGV